VGLRPAELDLAILHARSKQELDRDTERHSLAYFPDFSDDLLPWDPRRSLHSLGDKRPERFQALGLGLAHDGRTHRFGRSRLRCPGSRFLVWPMNLLF
jgi:hypothetical protein